MEISEYKNIYDNEKEHFFYVSTHRLVYLLIKKWLKTEEPKILDAGCGTGGLMDILSGFGATRGIDFSSEAVKFAKARGHKVYEASVEKIPFRDNTFDLVTSIDVIYHKAVKNDVRALSEFARVLKPNGVLILRVPANKFLMSAHDRHVHTARRYSMTELKEKLSKSGFKLERISYVHSPLFLVSVIRVLFEKLFGSVKGSGVQKVGKITNRLIILLLDLEGLLIRLGVTLPFGQGLIAVCKKGH